MTSKILRADGVTELTNIKSVTFHETVNSETDLRPGCVGSAYIEVEVFGSQSSAPTAGEAVTYYQVDSNSNETLIGTFYATPAIETRNSYRFVAYDAVSKLDADFSEWLSANQTNFPMTVYNLVSAACTKSGVALSSATWPNSTMTIQAFYADGITCRQILAWAAEIACRFVRANTSGAIVFDWYTNASDSIGPGVGTNIVAYRQDGLTYENYQTATLDRVAVHPIGSDDTMAIYPQSVSNGNTLHIGDNVLLTGASESTLDTVAQTIYNTMTALGRYTPASCALFPGENPFRAGQIVSVTDSQNVTITTVVMAMTVSPDSAQIESTGGETYSSEYNQAAALTATNAGQRASIQNLGDQIQLVVTELDEKNRTYSAGAGTAYAQLCTKSGDPICTKSGDPILAAVRIPSGTALDDYTVGDLWYNTDEDNAVYWWNGTYWEPVADQRISEISQKLDSITLRVVGADGVTSEIQLNDAGQINLLGTVLAQRIAVDELMARNLTATGTFQVDNGTYFLTQTTDGFEFGSYGSNASPSTSITADTTNGVNIETVQANITLTATAGGVSLTSNNHSTVNANGVLFYSNGVVRINGTNQYAVFTQTKTVTGSTSASGNINLGLSNNSYAVLSVRRTDAGSICIPYITAAGAWYAHVMSSAASPAVVASTSVTLQVDYYSTDFSIPS